MCGISDSAKRRRRRWHTAIRFSQLASAEVKAFASQLLAPDANRSTGEEVKPGVIAEARLLHRHGSCVGIYKDGCVEVLPGDAPYNTSSLDPLAQEFVTGGLLSDPSSKHKFVDSHVSSLLRSPH